MHCVGRLRYQLAKQQITFLFWRHRNSRSDSSDQASGATQIAANSFYNSVKGVRRTALRFGNAALTLSLRADRERKVLYWTIPIIRRQRFDAPGPVAVHDMDLVLRLCR